MLSRVADALFWMSRYVERAEHVARLLDVWFHLELDLPGVWRGPRRDALDQPGGHPPAAGARQQRRRRLAQARSATG